MYRASVFPASLGFRLVLSFRWSKRKTYLVVAFLSVGFAFTLRWNTTITNVQRHETIHACELLQAHCFLRRSFFQTYRCLDWEKHTYDVCAHGRRQGPEKQTQSSRVAHDDTSGRDANPLVQVCLDNRRTWPACVWIPVLTDLQARGEADVASPQAATSDS